MKPFTASAEPMSYWVWVIGETAAPASAPMAAARKNEMATMVDGRMPHRRAAVGLSAQARMARPSRVKRKNRPSAATISAETPSTQNTCGEMRAPRRPPRWSRRR